jgi:probable F420-dependent oxidoreductase
VWTTDHLLLPASDAARFGTIFEAVTTLAYLAGRTERIRLGVSSLVLPMRHPVVVAKQIATLDVLSGGRAMLCVSVGWSEGEYANLGVRFAGRGRRLEDSVQVLRRLWSADPSQPVDLRAGATVLEQAVFSPAPVQPGGPPLWMGGNSEAAVRRAARMADGWHGSSLGIEDFTRRVALLRLAAPDRRLVISLRLRLSYDPESDALLRGEPAAIGETLRGYARQGLEVAVVDFLPGAASLEQRSAALRRFREEVSTQDLAA